MFSSRKTAASSGGYSIGKSLRFRSSASAYLNRTFSSPTSSTIYTWSGWVKRGTLSSTQYLFGASTTTNFGFNSSNNLVVTLSGTTAVTTSAVFRDPSAWYHIMYVQNGSAQTLYVNGVSVGTGTTANTVFNTAIAHQISAANTTNYFDGYLAEINFIDGTALTPSSFGAYDTNGVWQPIKYSGSYGTNGFYLNFGNTASTTTLGYDTSGNGNNWTTNNISLTPGSTYDSMIDSPTVSATSSNYCTLNPLTPSNSGCANGNLTLNYNAGASTLASFGVNSGKWYYETTLTTQIDNQQVAGLVTNGFSLSNAVGQDAYSWGIIIQSNTSNGQAFHNNATISTSTTFANGDIAMVAFDVSAGKVWFGKNGTWLNSGNPSAGTNPIYTDLVAPAYPALTNKVTAGGVLNANFGQRPFSYTPPTGFNALNTYNLPAATINNGALYMAATLWTGNGTSLAVNNGNNNTISTTFQPDFIWVKDRSATRSSVLTDVVRGVDKNLFSDTTDSEQTSSVRITSFNSNGFSVGSGLATNANTEAFVGWQWKAAGSSSSNTNGTITSTVSANTTAGFSVVTYTGTGANATVGHGLSVAPSMIITKKRSSTSDWGVYHTSTGNTNYLLLDSTAASAASSTYWNNTSPTSSVFYIGTADPVNINTATYVAYCWAAVAGYSAFGSYTGNNSSDGPFVYTGFRPRWIMVKDSTTAGTNWIVLDTSRDTYNVEQNYLSPNTSSAEGSATAWDGLSNGFKLRASGTPWNASGATIIYAAFAENPFNYSRAR